MKNGVSRRNHNVDPLQRLSIEAGILVLTGTIFAISPHIFPWYATALLPWVAVLLQPLWTRQGGWHPDGLAVAMAWYFPCVIVLHYFFDRLPDWTLYYAVVYDVVLIGGGITAYLGILNLPLELLAHQILSSIGNHIDD